MTKSLCTPHVYCSTIHNSPADEWIKKMWDVHTMEYYSDIKTDNILSFATRQLELEVTCKVKYARHKRQMPHELPHMWHLKTLTTQALTVQWWSPEAGESGGGKGWERLTNLFSLIQILHSFIFLCSLSLLSLSLLMLGGSTVSVIESKRLPHQYPHWLSLLICKKRLPAYKGVNLCMTLSPLHSCAVVFALSDKKQKCWHRRTMCCFQYPLCSSGSHPAERPMTFAEPSMPKEKQLTVKEQRWP
jgi:hypothetical protein